MRAGWLRPLVALAVAAFLLTGCSMLAGPPYTFEGTLPAQGDLAPLPVRLFDQSGTVTKLELPIAQPARPPAVANDTFAAAVPGISNAVFVVWLGGLCDQQVDIEYTGGDTTFTITTVSGQGGCRLAGVQRSVIVHFSSPVDLASFTVQDMD